MKESNSTISLSNKTQHSNDKSEGTVQILTRNQLIADRIKKAREKKDWTQEQLAYMSKVGIATISRAENAQNELRRSTASLLASALGVRTEWIMFDDDFKTEDDLKKWNDLNEKAKKERDTIARRNALEFFMEEVGCSVVWATDEKTAYLMTDQYQYHQISADQLGAFEDDLYTAVIGITKALVSRVFNPVEFEKHSGPSERLWIT